MDHGCPLCGCAEPSHGPTDAVGYRFWSKIDVRGPDDCWEWRGARSAEDYGRFRMPVDAPGHEGKVRGAHRVAFWLHTGWWPEDAVVRHGCDNPPCVNPAHLTTGTHADNARDKLERGRQPANVNSTKTACKRGHPLTGDNLGINRTTGNRYCKACKRAWNRTWRATRSL